MGWFSRRRPAPHPHLRELAALQSCVVAWRRSVLEHWLESDQAGEDELSERLDSLRSYAEYATGLDPLAQDALMVPVGQLDQSELLLATYRIEAASTIAWALQLAPEIPQIEERADTNALAALFPLDGPPGWSRDDVTRRPPSDIRSAGEDWSARAQSAFAERTTPESHVEFSRAFERARGLLWVESDLDSLDDVHIELGSG